MSLSSVRSKLRVYSNWWFRVSVISALDDRWLPRQPLEDLLNSLLCNSNGEVAAAAARKLFDLKLKITCRSAHIHPHAQKVLHGLGMLKRPVGHCCPIGSVMARLCGERSIQPNWKAVFGSDYPQAQIIAVRLHADYRNNSSSFAMALNTFMDLVVKAIYRHEPALGVYPSSAGGALKARRFKARYPHVSRLLGTHGNSGTPICTHIPVTRRPESEPGSLAPALLSVRFVCFAQ
jgi:hypothetical protein